MVLSVEVAKACLSRHGRKECVRCQKEQNSIALEHSRRNSDGRIKKGGKNVRSRPAKIASVDIDVCVYDRADKQQSPLRPSNCGSWQPQMTSAGTAYVQIGSLSNVKQLRACTPISRVSFPCQICVDFVTVDIPSVLSRFCLPNRAQNVFLYREPMV